MIQQDDRSNTNTEQTTARPGQDQGSTDTSNPLKEGPETNSNEEEKIAESGKQSGRQGNQD